MKKSLDLNKLTANNSNSLVRNLIEDEKRRRLDLKRFFKKKTDFYESVYPKYPYSQLEIDTKHVRRQSQRDHRRFVSNLSEHGFDQKEIHQIDVQIHDWVAIKLKDPQVDPRSL